RVVDLAVEGRGRRVAQVVVGVPDDLLRLVLERARRLLVEVADRVLDALPLPAGAVTRSFQTSPTRPATPPRRAPGDTRTRSRVEGAAMRSVYGGVYRLKL